MLTEHSNNYSNMVGICMYVKKCICSFFLWPLKKCFGALYTFKLFANDSNCFIQKRKKSAVHFTMLLLQHTKLLSSTVLKFGFAINFDFSFSTAQSLGTLFPEIFSCCLLQEILSFSAE